MSNSLDPDQDRHSVGPDLAKVIGLDKQIFERKIVHIF